MHVATPFFRTDATPAPTSHPYRKAKDGQGQPVITESALLDEDRVSTYVLKLSSNHKKTLHEMVVQDLRRLGYSKAQASNEDSKAYEAGRRRVVSHVIIYKLDLDEIALQIAEAKAYS